MKQVCTKLTKTVFQTLGKLNKKYLYIISCTVKFASLNARNSEYLVLRRKYYKIIPKWQLDVFYDEKGGEDTGI